MLQSQLKRGYREFVSTPANILVPMILFVLLVPGVLLTAEVSSGSLLSVNPGVLVQEGVSSLDQVLGMVVGPSSMSSVLVHSVVLGLVLFLLRSKFSQYY